MRATSLITYCNRLVISTANLLDEEIVASKYGQSAIQNPDRHLLQPRGLSDLNQAHSRILDVSISALELVPQPIDQLGSISIRHELDDTPQPLHPPHPRPELAHHRRQRHNIVRAHERRIILQYAALDLEDLALKGGEVH